MAKPQSRTPSRPSPLSALPGGDAQLDAPLAPARDNGIAFGAPVAAPAPEPVVEPVVERAAETAVEPAASSKARRVSRTGTQLGQRVSTSLAERLRRCSEETGVPQTRILTEALEAELKRRKF